MIWEFICAFEGKLQWSCLRRRYFVEQYIFMPHQQEQYNEYTLQYLDAYMKKEKINSICIVTCDRDIYKKIKTQADEKTYRVVILLRKKNWIYKITKFYALYEFSNKIKIISLTEPYDTCGENLLGVYGITKRELLCYDILGFETIPD